MLKIFPKPSLSPVKQKENLEYDINRLQIKFERLTGDYDAKTTILEEYYQSKKDNLNRNIAELENILVSKRQERLELEKPLIDREQNISNKELEIKGLFNNLESRNNELSNKELYLKKQEEIIENFADDLGEKRFQIEKRLKATEVKEQILKDKEQDYLLKIDIQNRLYNAKDEEWQKKFKELDTMRIVLETKEANFKGREDILFKKERLLNDRYQTLERSIKRK